MPGRVFLTATEAEVAAAFGANFPAGALGGARMDAAPGETFGLVVGADAAGPRRVVQMRWGLIPMGRVNARGRPVLETLVNARSETLFEKSAFEGLRRAVLPVSGWYEWTGARRRKTRWRISDPATPILGVAAVWDLWRAPGGAELASFATVTVEPNVDVAPIHHRMGALLAPEDCALWLGEAAGDPAAALRPWPDGRLEIEKSDLP